jgi:hypothetical protein
MSREEDMLRAAEAGYARCIVKPADPEGLRELLRVMEGA